MNDAEIKAKLDEIVRLCLAKWEIKNDDDRILKFKEELPLFIQEFDDSSMSMIESLLYRFDYFSHENINKRLVVECSVKLDKALEDSELKCRKNEFKRLSEKKECFEAIKYANLTPIDARFLKRIRIL